MGEMTNEEAIALLEDQMNFNRTMQRGWGNSMIKTDAGNIVDGALYANQHKDVADALELAINALRAGVKDMNVTTMPAGKDAVSIADLLARAESVEERCKELEERCKRLNEARERANEAAAKWESMYRVALERAERAEETASDLCDDFTDFVTGGVHNAAPYCANRRPECVNARGWCDGDNLVCRGFMPKAAVWKKEE